MTEPETVPLREHLEMQLVHEREMRAQGDKAIEHERELRATHDLHERELRKEKEAAVEQARSIQFAEYERRLDSLNHAHEQALEERRLTVSSETYNTYVEQNKAETELAVKNVETAVLQRQVEVDRRLAILEASDQTEGGRRLGLSSARLQSNWTTERVFASVVILVGIIEFALRSGIVK